MKQSPIDIHIGDCREIMAGLAPESVQCCVTSPPYWGLRDYGTRELDFPATSLVPVAGLPPIIVPAWTGHLGHEPDPWMFVGHIVDVFRAVRRVLKDDGTLWMNFGDCYSSNAGGSQGSTGQRVSRTFTARLETKAAPGVKIKDLMGIPWRVAFALQADGWFLRMDNIWHKPNPMPESIADRPTKAHEYLFLLSKSERYFYDAEAIKERCNGTAHSRGTGVNPKAAKYPAGWHFGPGAHKPIAHQTAEQHRKIAPSGSKQNASFSAAVSKIVDARNKRSVWTVPSRPYSEAHFATYPPDLIKPCILAGSRPGDTILDPFGGSGTTGAVALELGRRAILCELNPEYAKLIEKRTTVTPGLALT